MIRGRARLSGGDAGDTLIEILISVVVLGLTVTAMIGGLTVATIATDTHRRLSDVEVVGRAYGEQVIDRADHLPTTTLTAAYTPPSPLPAKVDISVDPSVNFPATPFTAAVDGEVVDVTKVTSGGGTWTVTALVDAHPQGSTASQYLFYDADNSTCPVAGDFQLNPATFTVPATSVTVGKINKPTITEIKYYTATGTELASGSTCNNYWKNTALPCRGYDPADQPHETQCDIELVRLKVSVESVDKNTQRGATTSNWILVRRGNA